MSIINETQFKVSCKEMGDYIKNVCDKLEKETNIHQRDNVVYISSPVTGINGYKQNFILMKEYIKYIYHDKDVLIIDPTEYLDAIPEELNLHPTYIDMIIFSLELLKYAGRMFIYDNDKEAWINSRGCLIEASYAAYNNIYMYNYDYTIKAAMNIKMNETNEKVEEFITFLKENDKETYYKLIASKEKVEGENNEEA